MIEWSQLALDEMQAIGDYLEKIQLGLGTKVVLEIFDDADFYEANFGLGKPIEKLPRDEYRMGLASNSNYKIYYRKLGSLDIRVLAVRSSKQKPLTARQIKARS